MSSNIKKLFINGYGWTGSSALVDYLSDFRNISVIPNEFDDLRVPYGFIDKVKMRINKIEGGCSRSFSDLAHFEPSNFKPISTRNKGNFFIFKMLLRALHFPIPFTKMWNKSFGYRKHFFFLFFKYLKESFVTKNYLRKVSHSLSVEELKLLPSKWINSISSVYSERNNVVCFDQALLIDNAIDYVDLLNDIFIVVVIREPEKQFADILEKNVRFLHNYPWKVRYLFGVGENDLKDIVKVFINSTSNRLDQLILLKKKMKKKLLFIDFDDFLKSPEMQLKKISDNTGIEFHKNKKTNFNIEKSRDRNRSLKIQNESIKKEVSSLNEKYYELKRYAY